MPDRLEKIAIDQAATLVEDKKAEYMRLLFDRQGMLRYNGSTYVKRQGSYERVADIKVLPKEEAKQEPPKPSEPENG